jgi:polyisoprenoid-binding protein YceI
MKKVLLVFSITMIVVFVLSACGLLQEPEEASAPIEATPVLIETSIDQQDEATQVIETQSDVEESSSEQSAAAEAVSRDVTVFVISQSDSQVRFELDEDLRGQRITVVGVTDQVAGEIAVNLDDLSTAQVGVMQINARTLLTDNDFRNRAIQNQILDTGDYEFITFEPTGIVGLPDKAAIGEQIKFTIEGNLTIRDLTNPVTFTVNARADSQGQISGTATTVINRVDYNLNIPSVPNVANVEEEVELYIDFVALAK